MSDIDRAFGEGVAKAGNADAGAAADLDRLLDEALDATFPASDPISLTHARPKSRELASAVEHHRVYSMWQSALSRLAQTKERLADASNAERPLVQMEYDDALAAYLAIADEL